MSRTKQSVQRELQQHYQNLDKVREKIALYSEMEAPISLLNQREQIEKEIEELQELVRAGQLPDESALPDQEISDEGGKPSQTFNIGQIKANVVSQGQQTIDTISVHDVDLSDRHYGSVGTVIEGDQIVQSGDFRGAIVNVKSQLDRVTQRIGSLPYGDSAEREALMQLVEELKQHLDQVPSEKVADAEKVSKRVEALVEEVEQAEPDQEMVGITAESLKRAATNLAKVVPTVLPIATQIVAHILKLAG